jgi:hypothetical protein
VGADLDRATASYYVIDDFLPQRDAELLREGFENHFSEPHNHSPSTHQVWNYWFVPSLYAYLRTTPEKVLCSYGLSVFDQTLANWSRQNLGLGHVGTPYLSLYTSGCFQGLHNDAANGRFAYVYSLTPRTRDTIGGRTLLFREEEQFLNQRRVPSSGKDFYDLIEPVFNRLIIFDDRLVHGVERIDGSMDPLHGRTVIHGHLSESGPFTTGSLTISVIADDIRETIGDFFDQNIATISMCYGCLVLRFTINPSGQVSSCIKLVDRLVYNRFSESEPASIQASLIARVKQHKFPSSLEDTIVTLPLNFSGIC